MQTQTLFNLGKLLAPLSIAATMVLSLSNQASAISLGAASDYNLFILGDVTQSNTDSEGKVAIAGNVEFSNFYVGMSLPTSGDNGDVLIVGENLNFSGGTVQGNAVYGGQANISNVTFNNNGTLRQDTPIDFNRAKQELQGLSTYLGGLTANGETTIASGGINLSGLDANLNIFNLDASDLSGASSFNIDVTQGSTAIVNIRGTSATLQNFGFNINGNPENEQRQKIIYNFFEADSLTASGIGIQGSVLAPWANFNFDNAQVNGNVITASLTGQGQSNNYLFNGNLPDPTPEVPASVPEPATLAGLGLVAAAGIASRRQRKQKG
ncbi:MULTISPECIES: choice-of-anchor A family protein [unclassified Coleofasciculus]|uniref:choice-of-anchor A family protein n=1 Tax=unclassified Coleofasciculus TaxID=2692782 RepID=UPI0018820439|nr:MULTISPECIES: choice-of-anchor A family protein [unclassified Coleofasciculus]MBE9125976.1 choice-of-anchor A family protein [Coleofasciculus sp. LEGE 07081]MBE9151170.1 choice-of-anchor A family protein [Coleofasciculus sp. LEGE 07092]